MATNLKFGSKLLQTTFKVLYNKEQKSMHKINWFFKQQTKAFPLMSINFKTVITTLLELKYMPIEIFDLHC